MLVYLLSVRYDVQGDNLFSLYTLTTLICSIAMHMWGAGIIGVLASVQLLGASSAGILAPYAFTPDHFKTLGGPSAGNVMGVVLPPIYRSFIMYLEQNVAISAQVPKVFLTLP